MPAFMTIGTYQDVEVEPGDIRGDATASWHEGWMHIQSFSVDMKDDHLLEDWSSKKGKSKSQRRQEVNQANAQANTGQSRDGTQGQEERRENILRVTKSTDSASTKIFEWAKTPVQQDIQIDCCTTEEEWPFLTMVFIGAVPIKAELQEEPSDSLEFSWKKAEVFTYAFDESNEPYAIEFAEFGEEEVPSGTTTAASRGLADYTAPEPDPSEGAPRAPAGSGLRTALVGGLPSIPEETQHYDQERRTLTIEALNDIEFVLESFRGSEKLSSLFVFDLELRSGSIAIDPADVVGHEVSFCIQDEADLEEDVRDPRFLSGVVSSLLIGKMVSDRQRRYYATVVPTAWRLTQRSDCRVFQDKDVKQVVEQVFKDADFSDYDIAGVTKTYAPMTFCVQYNETDFAFVSRLLEEFGIFYYFKQEEGKHTMMLCDGTTAYVSLPDPLRFAHDVHREPRVTAWRTSYSFFPGKFDSRDWNFTTPKEPLKGQSSTQIDLPGIQDAEIFEFPGYYEDTDQGTTVADLRLQERETGHRFVHAVSCYDHLVPGTTFTLENPPGEEEGGEGSQQEWVITGIRHHAEQLPEYGLSIIGYRNHFTCIPAELAFVPPRATPKPRIYGPHTAVVVGDKETDEDLVDTDKYGRIKVQFHWDRKGKKDTDSSCWIRVAQSLAGSGYGAMALPRIGWEVVVSFIDGDPDRPLVTGVVYNELHMPYHELPGAKHKTVLMTRSFPNGGKDNFNELTFHDEKDKEEIYFHAERDFKRVVEHDDVLEIGEKEDGGQTVTIQGDQAITIAKGNRELTVSQGDQTTTVETGNDTLTVSSGNYTVDVSSGKIEVSAAQSIELKVGGNTVKIDTMGIELKVGGSKIKVDNTGVEVKGMTVKAEGTASLELKGLMTKVSGDGMLETKGGITMMQ